MEQQTNHNNSDELTLKELVLLIQEYVRDIIRKWWLIMVITAVSVSYFMYKHFTHITTYTAEIEFLVEGSSAPTGGLGGLLGQIGMGSGSYMSPYKTQEVAKSSVLLKKVLRTKIEGEVLANHILDAYQLTEEWSKTDANFTNFRFMPDSLFAEDRLSQIAFKRLNGLIWQGQGNEGVAISSMAYNLDNGILTMRCTSRSKLISRALNDLMYENLKYFFELDLVQNKRKALKILDSKLDSLSNLRQQKTIALASFDTYSSNLIDKVYGSSRSTLQQDLIMLSNAYATIIQNREIADFNLRNNSPVFLMVDRSLDPLSGNRSQLKKKIITGALAGLFISVFLIVLLRLYKTVMK